MRKFSFLLANALFLNYVAQAQECVVSDLTTRVPIRDVTITVDSIIIRHTTWRGTCQLPDSFHLASFVKKGYMKETLTQEEVRRDTVFLVPEEHQLDEVVVWGRHLINLDSLRSNIPQRDPLYKAPHQPLAFDLSKMLDFRHQRDMKQLEKMRKVFNTMDEQEQQRDPIMRAYEQTQAELAEKKAEQSKTK